MFDCVREQVPEINVGSKNEIAELKTFRKGHENVIITYSGPAEEERKDKPRLAKEFYKHIKK